MYAQRVIQVELVADVDMSCSFDAALDMKEGAAGVLFDEAGVQSHDHGHVGVGAM